MASRLGKWSWPAITLVVVAGFAAVLYARNPSGAKLFPPCPFHALTGLHCPGCGSLRATHQLLHGHLTAALKLNPLMVLSIPYLIYGYIAHVTLVNTGKTLPWSQPKVWVIWSIFALLILYWVLRNIPVYPFTLLAPHQ